MSTKPPAGDPPTDPPAGDPPAATDTPPADDAAAEARISGLIEAGVRKVLAEWKPEAPKAPPATPPTSPPESTTRPTTTLERFLFGPWKAKARQ